MNALNRDLEVRVAERTRDLEAEMHERKRSEDKRRELSEHLVKASLLAGMAEVTTSVLHNVSNVLNSANISSKLLEQSMRRSRADSV